jgi:hypothetical protein
MREGDARALVVRRRVVERPGERGTLVGSHRGVVQPENLKERRAGFRNGPFALGSVGERDVRDVTRRVISRDDVIIRAPPAIVARIPGHGQAGRDVLPPRGRRHVDRLELDDVAGGTFAAPRDAEVNGELSVASRQRKARGVELQRAENVRGASFFALEERALANDGIAHSGKRATRVTDEAIPGVAAEEIPNAALFARPEVDDAVPRYVPRLFVGNLYVEMILI